jgi:superfamily II DNA or RNA helicase
MMLTNMRFKGAWRDYQARVPAEMDGHLSDARLHIVAAPGSGKTILGLELMRRIGRPAVILAPSLTIRNQWRERLFPLFLDDPHG